MLLLRSFRPNHAAHGQVQEFRIEIPRTAANHVQSDVWDIKFFDQYLADYRLRCARRLIERGTVLHVSLYSSMADVEQRCVTFA